MSKEATGERLTRTSPRMGITWGRRAGLPAALSLALAGSLAATAAAAPAPSPRLGPTVSVIVRQAPHAGPAPERAVARLGGRVERRLAIIDGFSARVPAGAVARLRAARGVLAVTLDRTLRAHGVLPGTGYDNRDTATSLYNAIRISGAQRLWARGITGDGVDVALIDTGVTRVEGLDEAGKVVDGPDLSFDSQDPGRRVRDNYGHGTHLAGIIAGRDQAGSPLSYLADSSSFLGIAPDARIVNMKVGDGNGVTDVSQVIAAVDWVVQHRASDGLDIRVIELAFGTDSTQSYRVDPLAFALEQAWRKGIFVVTAAGNSGKDNPNDGLASPAVDPHLFAVGASDPQGTVVRWDDDVAAFSSAATSDSRRAPDVVAPGVSIPSLKVPGSKIATTYCATGCLGARFFKGSGTSQASALVAGGAALLIQQRPWITPDQLKDLLDSQAVRLFGEPSRAQGNGLVRFDEAMDTPLRQAAFAWWGPASTGTGSLDASRGTRRAQLDGTPISGEVDIFGNPWDSAQMAAAAANGSTWSGGSWNGSTWSGSTWSGSTWSGSTWSGSTWSGSTWSGSTWSGSTWSGSTWSGSTWSGSTWSGSTWSSARWR